MKTALLVKTIPLPPVLGGLALVGIGANLGDERTPHMPAGHEHH
jgi:hypothetical protein